MELPESPIPSRMLRASRDTNPEFAPTESIYLRFTKEAAATDIIDFRMPNTSVNRSWPDGEPFDVLLPKYQSFGVVQFESGRIPREDRAADRGPLDYRLCHDPLDDNYYHCEIRAFRPSSEKVLPRIDSSMARRWFKTELNRHMTVLKQPEA